MFKSLLEGLRKNKLPPIDVPQLMDAYSRHPVCFARGKASILWDIDGNQYIDALAGNGAAVLGHGHPAVSEAISLQADKLLHVGNAFHIQEQADLAQKFCSISGLEKVYFSHSPADANQVAIELVVGHAKKRGQKSPTVVCLSSHLAATSVDNLCNTETVTFGDIDSLGVYAANESVVAVLLPSTYCAESEKFCDKGYLQAVRHLCDEHDWLLILDETCTGLGRTGRWFAYQKEDILPDVIVGVAALGNGLPIGVCAARGDVASFFKPGDQSSQFGGSPFASRVALTVINIIEQENLLANASHVGEYLKRKIQHHIGTLSGITDIRGTGMMIVIELEEPRKNLAAKFLVNGLVVEVVGHEKIIRLTPAITLSEKEAGKIAECLHDVLTVR